MVRCDLMLDSELRLTEHERSLLIAILRQLIGDIANEVNAKLPKQVTADDNWDALTARLLRSGLLDDQDLLALLLRRAEEERVSANWLARSKVAPANLLQRFITDSDGQVAATAMAALIARARRRDRFGGPVVELNDLGPAAAASLVFAIAAGLAASTREDSDERALLSRFHDAARAVIIAHDPARGMTRALEQLTGLLAGLERIDDELIVAAIHAADLSLLAALLGARAAISSEVAFQDLLSRDTHKVMVLLRLSDTPRTIAAHLVGTLGDLIGIAPDPTSLATFDTISETELLAAREWRTFDRSYQSALNLLGLGDVDKPL